MALHVIQRVAMSCNVLQCLTVSYSGDGVLVTNKFQLSVPRFTCGWCCTVADHVLQCVVVYYSVLQCVAVCYNGDGILVANKF